jgi:hypothetical protein
MFNCHLRFSIGVLKPAFWVVAVALAFANVTKADTTYYFQDYPPYEGGCTIAGSIVTDGVTGPLSSADVISESLWVSYPGETIFPQSPQVYVLFPAVGLVATQTELLLEPGPPYSRQVYQIYSAATFTGVDYFSWVSYSVTVPGFDGGPESYEFSGGAGSSFPPDAGQEWDTFYDPTQPPDPSEVLSLMLDASGNMIIATAVPEPSTLTLLFSALLGLAGAFYLRRRRAKA